jgi:hypothetical protein
MSHYDSCNEPPEETIKRLMGRIVELENKLKLEKAASDEQESRLRFAQDEAAKALARAEAAEQRATQSQKSGSP